MEPFASFEEFVKNVIPGYSFEHPAREHCRIWNNKINFIHCNSAVVSDAEDKDEQLFDINTFAKLALDSTLPSIILIHNNINDIDKNQQEQIKGVIRNSTIKAYFCGDRHIQQADMINVLEKQNCQIPCIGSYKSAPDAKDNYSSYGIIIGTWIEEKAELEGWTWSMKKSFQLDNIITGQTIEMGEKYNNQVVKNDTGNSREANESEVGELLQLILELLKKEKKLVDIKFIMSAWDVVEEEYGTDILPEQFTQQKFPLLYQCIKSNQDQIRPEFWGISAIGGDLNNPEEVKRLQKEEINAIKVVMPDGRKSNDLTALLAEIGDEK